MMVEIAEVMIAAFALELMGRWLSLASRCVNFLTFAWMSCVWACANVWCSFGIAFTMVPRYLNCVVYLSGVPR